MRGLKKSTVYAPTMRNKHKPAPHGAGLFLVFGPPADIFPAFHSAVRPGLSIVHKPVAAHFAGGLEAPALG